jgi:hypothetical protein
MQIVRAALSSQICARLALGLALCGLSCGGALAQAKFPPTADGRIKFLMPSRNIGCTFTPEGGTEVRQPLDGGPELLCDRSMPEYVRVVLTLKAVWRFNDVANRDCCDSVSVWGKVPIFAYGTRWTQGPFVCESLLAGLSCRRPDGRGFTMSLTNVVSR